MNKQIKNAIKGLQDLAEEVQMEKQNDFPSADKRQQQVVSVVEALKDKLEAENLLFGECQMCGTWFIDSASTPVYCITDDECLCESCHAKRFPTERSWNKYIVKNWMPDTIKEDEYNQMIANDFANVSDERLEKLSSDATDEPECPIYYTES